MGEIVVIYGHNNIYTINSIMASSPSHYEELLNESIDAIIHFLFQILPRHQEVSDLQNQLSQLQNTLDIMKH